MSIEMEITFKEKIDSKKLDELIEELNDEEMKLDENLGEMRTFTDVGQVMGDPLEQILIAVVAGVLTRYVERNIPMAEDYTRKLLRKVYTKVKRLSRKARIVIKKEGKESIPLELGTKEEIEKVVKTLSSG